MTRKHLRCNETSGRCQWKLFWSHCLFLVNTFDRSETRNNNTKKTERRLGSKTRHGYSVDAALYFSRRLDGPFEFLDGSEDLPEVNSRCWNRKWARKNPNLKKTALADDRGVFGHWATNPPLHTTEPQASDRQPNLFRVNCQTTLESNAKPKAPLFISFSSLIALAMFLSCTKAQSTKKTKCCHRLRQKHNECCSHVARKECQLWIFWIRESWTKTGIIHHLKSLSPSWPGKAPSPSNMA